MKKWAVVILSILAVFAFAAAAQADITMEARFDTEEPIRLWDSVCFALHSDTIRNEAVKFYFDEGTDPTYPWIDDNGNGEAWFTPGTVDTFIYEYKQDYNADNLTHRYKAYVQRQGDENDVSEKISYSTVMFPEEAPVFAPVVTNVSSGSLRQDETFHATVSNEHDFDIMCFAVFDGDGFVADSHWSTIDHDAETTDLDVPLVKCTVNRQYTAKVYGLKYGYPMAYDSREWTFRVISPSVQDENSDIIIGGLRNQYSTGEGITATAFYANNEGLSNITMDVGVYCLDYDEVVNNPDRWDLNATFWPDGDGCLYYQPEGWEVATCWMSGNYKLCISVWQEEEDGQRILVDSTERTFFVTSNGVLDFDPGLPVYIDAVEMPYELTIPRVKDADFYDIRMENWDDHDWDKEPDWNNVIGEFHEWDPEGLDTVTISDVHQRISVVIDAGKTGYDFYHYETVIPIVNLGDGISLWTKEELAAAQPLPIHMFVPLWVEAPGARWISVERENDRFDYRDDPRELAGTIETGRDLNREGKNIFIATAGFYDEEHDAWTEEQALLILEAYAEGIAGQFTASLDKNSISRGDPVTVTYTKSEHSNHYWVDLDVWNGDRNEWQWYTHLGDLDFEGANNGGSARMNTLGLEPNIYRVRALAEGPGYFTSEYVITESFAVQEAQLPASGILVNVSAEGNAVETCEDFELSAYAPGAAWMQVFWNHGAGDWNWENNEGRDACSWGCSYSHSGEYQILVRAWYDEKDENGNQIWEIDEETGEIHTNEDGEPDRPRQYPVDETVTMTVSAENGELVLTPPDNLPTTVAPADSERTVQFTVAMPENGEYLRAEAWFEGVEDGGLCWQETWEGDLNVSFSFVPENGRTIGIKLVAEARGFEGAELYYQIPVIPEESSELVVITLDPEHGSVYADDNGLYHAPIHSDVRFLVNAAEGHTLTAVKFYGMNGWWEEGAEINHNNHGDWFEEDGSAFFHEGVHDDRRIGSTVQVFAMIRVDGGDTWYTSAPFLLYVDDYQVGPYDFRSREPVTVVLGENAVFSFTESAGANRYWVDAWNANDPHGGSYNPDTTCTGTTVVLNTAQLHEGEFIIRGRAGIEGQDGLREADSDIRLIVTASGVPDGDVILTVDKTEAITGEEISASVFAPGADWVEIIRRQENGDERDFVNRGGSGAAGSFREDGAQTLQIFGRAHYFERDEHGEPIIEGQNEWGDDIYKELDWHESDVAVVTVTAPNGRIAQDSSGIPVSAQAGEALTLTMSCPENADYLGWELYLNRDDEDDRQEPDFWGNDVLEMTIPGNKIILGNMIELRVWVGGRGYDHNHQNYTIPVINGNEDRIRLTVSKTEVETNENFTVMVTINEPGVDSFQYNNGNGFWKHWDNEQGCEVIYEQYPDENGIWIHENENYADSGIQTLYARAWINGAWVISEPVRVTVTSSGRVGESSINLERQTVSRGEIAVLHYEPAEHSDEERYDLHHDRNRSGDDEEHFVDYNLDWQRNTEENTITFSTAGMPEGEYWLSIWTPGERGYDSRESGSVWLTVTSSSVQDGAVVLTVDKTSALTGEQISASVFAPGADWVEIIRRQENGEEHDIANNGGFGTSGTFNENWAQTLQVFGRAHYFERNENGDPIVEGQNEWGDIYKELDWHESETVEITISAPNGRIAQDTSGIPVSAKAGEDLVLRMNRPANADYLGWELYLNRDYGNDRQEPDFRGEDILNLTVPGNEVILGNIIELRVWVGGVGYDHNHQNYTIMVTDGEEARVRLAVSKNEVQTGENFTVTVTAEDASYIQYYNGNVFWTDWDDAQGQEVIRNLELDENHQWIHTEQNYDESGVKTLYARAWINDEWVMSEPVKVTVSSVGQVGSFSINLEEAEVIRGETAVLCYEEAEHSVEERYDLHHDRNRSGDDEEHFVDYHLHWQRDTEANIITFSTAEMPAGEYWLSIWTPGEQGYESRESGNIRLTVRDPEEPAVSLNIDRITVQTNEDVQAGVYAPGAVRIEVSFDNNNDIWGTDGDSYTCYYQYNQAGIYQLTARAYYQDGTYADSDPVLLTVTSNGQQIPLDLSRIPSTLTAGEEVTFRVDWPAGADYLGWELYTDRNFDNWEQQPEYRGDDSFSVTIPSGVLREGSTVQLKVWTGAVGYDNHFEDVRIPVIGGGGTSLGITLDSEMIQTCGSVHVTVTFPADTYEFIQFFDGENYYGEESIREGEEEKEFETGFGFTGQYSLYARLWNGTDYAYTEIKEVTVEAPEGRIEFDTTVIPGRLYEGVGAEFTLTKPFAEADLNYELRNDTTGEVLISWEDGGKDGHISIPADKIIAGQVFQLNYNVFAAGYEPVSDRKNIPVYGRPVVTLSADRKAVKYGEDVVFTVNAPDAETKKVRKLNGEGDPTDLPAFSWNADQLGPVQFEAAAEFAGFSETVISNTVSVNVSSLGAAPAPAVNAPDTAGEGDTISVIITPAEGGWANVSIFDGGQEPVQAQDNITAQQTVSVSNVHAGDYQVYIDYGKAGYDDGAQIRIDIAVAHVYRAPAWTWAEDYSSASAVFTCVGGEDIQEKNARISSAVTREPTCGATGLKVYTATVTFQGQDYTDTREEALPTVEHVWGRPVFTWTDAGEGYTVTALFTCEADGTHTRSGEVEISETGSSNATCTEPATRTYRASCEGFSEQKTKVTGEPLGHAGQWRIVWNDDYTAYALFECDRCPWTERTAAEVTSEVVLAATCETKGEVLYTATASPDGQEITSTKKQYTPKTGHTPGEATYTEDGMMLIECTVCHSVLYCDYPHGNAHQWDEVTYDWAEDYSTVTATRTCRATPDHPHSETETVRTTAVVTKEPTCEEKGQTTYTAVFTHAGFGTKTKTVEDISALGHRWGPPTYEWKENNSKVTATRICANDPAHVEMETVNTTSEITRTATCDTKGETTYTAVFTNTAFAEQHKSLKNIDALGHHMTAYPASAASCTTQGSSAYWYCDRCRKYFSDEAGETEIEENAWIIPATGHHMTAHPAVAAGCTTPGSSAYWYCDKCEKYFSDEAGETEAEANSWIIPATGHDNPLQHTERKEATCTVPGNTEYWYCSGCGQYFSDADAEHVIAQADTVIPASHDLKHHAAAAATCMAAGNTEYWQCEACGACFGDAAGEHVLAEGSWIVPADPDAHDWNDTVYEWAEDNSEATATKTCKHNPSHIRTETVSTTSAVTKPASCTENGETTYTAVFTTENFGTKTRTVANIDDLGGHTWGAPTYTWSGNNSACTAKRVCARDPAHVETENATVTAKTTPATRTAAGKTVYTAAFTNPAFAAQTKEVTIPKLTAPAGSYTDKATGTYEIKSDWTAVFKKPAKSKATVTVPDTVKVKGYDIPVTAIADKAFSKDKNLATVTIGKNVTTVGKNAFSSCAKLKTVKGGTAVEVIKDSAFSGCVKLGKLPAFPKLKTIGANAFKGCKALTKVTIGANVNSIGKNAFNGCAALKTITIKSTLLTKSNVKNGAFKGINAKATVKCPKKKLKDYQKFLPGKGVPKTAKIK